MKCSQKVEIKCYTDFLLKYIFCCFFVMDYNICVQFASGRCDMYVLTVANPVNESGSDPKKAEYGIDSEENTGSINKCHKSVDFEQKILWLSNLKKFWFQIRFFRPNSDPKLTLRRDRIRIRPLYPDPELFTENNHVRTNNR